MAITTTSDIDAGVSNYYDKMLLAFAEPKLIHMIGAQMRPIPSKNSKQIKFRRYSKFATATTPLVEGVTPVAQSLSKTDITLNVVQYGAYVVITDMVKYTVEDEVLSEAGKLLGAQMGETMDEIVRDVLASTLSATNCVAGQNGGTPTELTYSDIMGVVRTLRGADANFFTPVVKGGNGQGTAPVRPSYYAFGHTDLINDLEACDKFVNVSNYANTGVSELAEWGQVGNTRWMLSSVGKEVSGTYSSFICGENAYAVTKLNEGMVSNIFQAPGGGDDPLEQRSSLGFKILFSSKILNDSWIVKLDSTLAN